MLYTAVSSAKTIEKGCVGVIRLRLSLEQKASQLLPLKAAVLQGFAPGGADYSNLLWGCCTDSSSSFCHMI